MLRTFRGRDITFIENMTVREGVSCDVYSFNGDNTKDLAIIRVDAGSSTPLQKVLSGDKTIEGHVSGKAILKVDDLEYNFPSDEYSEVEIQVGQIVRWTAIEDLVFFEECTPPYQDGRYQDLD